MKFNCVKSEIDKLTAQRDEAEGDLKVAQREVSKLSKNIYRYNLLITHTKDVLESLNKENCINMVDAGNLDNSKYTEVLSVPFWAAGKDANKHGWLELSPSGDLLVSKDFHVKLLLEEIEHVDFSVAIFVSNDTKGASSVSVLGLAGKARRVIPLLPESKLLSLPDVFSYSILENEDMKRLITEERLGVWISYQDYQNTFDVDSLGYSYMELFNALG